MSSQVLNDIEAAAATFHLAFDALSRTADEVVQTHCAVVFLSGAHAFKIKKPVDLGYLDFSTVEQRRWAILREFDLNRRAAPDLYLGVMETNGEPVLKMRRFDRSAVLAEAPECVDADLAETLGRTIARFHRDAERRDGAAENLAYVLASNAGHLRDLLPGAEAEALIAAADAAFAASRPLLDRRSEAGFARRCHGDLHLGNILVEAGRPVLFDCIEFNDRLSAIDVLYDLAFLLMDLDVRGRRAEAARVLHAWLDESAREGDPAMWEGLAALPLFLSTRAAVRCHVGAQAGDPAAARRYLEAALGFLEPRPAVLVAVGGLSGSGKTTTARKIAPGLGPAPGAVVLRSDEVRKRLWRVGPLDPLPPEAYAPAESERVYARLLTEARGCLEAGRAVVLDATFREAAHRRAAEALAASVGVPFEGWWMEAPADELRRRVEARIGDASDADVSVLDAQLSAAAEPVEWARRGVA